MKKDGAAQKPKVGKWKMVLDNTGVCRTLSIIKLSSSAEFLYWNHSLDDLGHSILVKNR